MWLEEREKVVEEVIKEAKEREEERADHGAMFPNNLE